MINLVYILAILLFPLGVYKILKGIFRMPDRKSSKMMLEISKKDKSKKSENKAQIYILNLSMKLGEHIKISDYKRKNMSASLKSVHIYMKPETYVARSLIYAGIVFIIANFAFILNPLIGAILLAVSVFIYFNEIGKLEDILKKKRKRIEYELPQFAYTLAEELKTTRNVVDILERNKNYLHGDLKNEIEILLSDMNSGSYETAISRFETRISSPKLTEITRGLKAVLNGDDQVSYFESTANSLKEEQRQQLKKIAVKRPDKITKYTVSMLGCVILMYFTILGTIILDSFTKIF